MKTILIAEDEVSIRRILIDIIQNAYPKATVLEATDGLEAWKMFEKEKIDLVLTDIKMPKLDGVELLEKIQKTNASIPIIITSGHGDLDLAVETLRKGAYDYISKPPDLNRLLTSIKNALESKQLKEENSVLRQKVSKQYAIIGDSKGIIEVQQIIDKIAPTEARAMILGPNGTGKELVARNIHEKSKRSRGSFIEVNCAAIPSELIESELFGHEKGSFTGAHKQKIGKFELASKGTLFLDEIGDMSLATQAKVLRALQENEITRVGGEKNIEVAPRVIAATNKDLKREIEKGTFREDLYHRLAVIILKVPSLNERREDIPLLIEHFSKSYQETQGMKPKKFDKKAISSLQKMDWTGNIRELRNMVERLMILGGDKITQKDIDAFSMK